MTGLKRLSKLRQYDRTKSPEDFLRTEFRQNNLAIEQSINQLYENTFSLYAMLEAKSVDNDTSADLTFDESEIVDYYTLLKSEKVTIKADGKYNFDFCFENLTLTGARACFLDVYKNGELSVRKKLFEANFVSTFRLSVTAFFWSDLKTNDVLSFKLFNDGSGSGAVTIDSGYFKLSKIDVR